MSKITRAAFDGLAANYAEQCGGMPELILMPIGIAEAVLTFNDDEQPRVGMLEDIGGMTVVFVNDSCPLTFATNLRTVQAETKTIYQLSGEHPG